MWCMKKYMTLLTEIKNGDNKNIICITFVKLLLKKIKKTLKISKVKIG